MFGDTMEHEVSIIHAKGKQNDARINPSYSGRRKIEKSTKSKKVIIVGKYNDLTFFCTFLIFI